MAARRESGNARITSLIGWPAGIALGLIGYIAIRWGIAKTLDSTTGHTALAMAGHLGAMGIATMLGVCGLGVIVYRLSQRARRCLASEQALLDDISILSWPVFEQHIGDIFRCRGYTLQDVEPDDRNNPIDLTLCKNGALTLVQCVRWRAHRIDVDPVRELYQQMPHHHAAAVKFIASGGFTRAARLFAQGKPIELIDGEALLAMLRKTHSTKVAE